MRVLKKLFNKCCSDTSKLWTVMFSRKGKGRRRYLELQSFNISSLFTVEWWGGVRGGILEDDTKKKKKKNPSIAHMIPSPPLKVHLNNMFRFCLKPFCTSSTLSVHLYVGSWATKDGVFCSIMSSSSVWTKVTYFDLCNSLVVTGRLPAV